MRLLFALLSLLTLPLVGACSDSADDRPSSTPQIHGRELPSLKLYVEDRAGERRLVEYPPLSSAPKATPGSDGVPRGYDTMVTTPDLEPNYSREEPVSSTWEVLKFAARECDRSGQTEGAPYYLDLIDGSVPWTDNAWFLYKQAGTCEQQLLIQENLVCVADKLAEVAEAVGTVEWLDGTVEIPPQANSDRIVARELALSALAHFARLGSRGATAALAFGDQSDGADRLSWDCVQQLESLNGDNLPFADVPAFSVESGQPTPTFTEGLEVGVENLDELIRPRIELRAHLYRAAGRMLRRLIEDAVEADLAGAEQARANSPSTPVGLERAWGLTDNGYGSLRHALTSLYGRLELSRDGTFPDADDTDGSSITDPRCQGYWSYLTKAPIERDPGERDLVDALPPGFSVHWQENVPTTEGDQLAGNLFMLAGVVPDNIPDVLPETGEGGAGSVTRAEQWTAAIRAVVADQLSRRAAIRDGFPAAELDGSKYDQGGAVAIRYELLLDRLTGEQLAAGASRAVWLYRSVAGTSENEVLTEQEEEARGLVRFDPDYASPLAAGIGVRLYDSEAWGGDALSGVAALGGVLAANQCDLTGVEVDRYSRAFDSVIGLADTLKQELMQLAETGDNVAAEGLGELVNLIDARMTVTVDGVTNNGVASEASVLVQFDEARDIQFLTLVAGQPWHVACLTGDRQSCPPLAVLEAATLPRVDDGVDSASPSTSVQFEAPSAPTTGETLYLIDRGTAASPGRVLAGVPWKDGRYVAHYSPAREVWTNQILGLQRSRGAKYQCVDDRVSSLNIIRGNLCARGTGRRPEAARLG